MTREEAIQELQNCKGLIQQDGQDYLDERDIPLLDMAIEALSKPINCIKCKHYYETEDDTGVHGHCRMDTAHTDLISRADAIEAVAQQWLFEASVECPYVNDDDIGEYRKLAEELFEDVPSAETHEIRTETHECVKETHDTDLISRADALGELNGACSNWEDDAKVAEIINALPSAEAYFTDGNKNAVEVVRCKDCKASRVYGKTTQWLACEDVMEGQATDPDGYCYLGERKNNAVEESEVEE